MPEKRQSPFLLHHLPGRGRLLKKYTISPDAGVTLYFMTGACRRREAEKGKKFFGLLWPFREGRSSNQCKTKERRGKPWHRIRAGNGWKRR